MEKEIKNLTRIRAENGIEPGSSCEILAGEADLYVAKVGGKIITKIGSRYDIGSLIPPGFQLAASGDGYAVWQMTG